MYPVTLTKQFLGILLIAEEVLLLTLMVKFYRAALILILPAAMLASCSTTRVLADGECRLAKNEVRIEGDTRLNAGNLGQYVKQKPNSSLIFGWNPFLNVYNWTGGKDNFFGRLFRKIGTPPVVFNPDLVESSAENIERHLEYLGYYGSTVEPVVDIRKKIAKVTYNVTPGLRYKISEIEYKLPDNPVFQASFHADTSRTLVRKGDYLSEEILETESQRASAYYRNSGYYSFSKNNFFFQADTLGTPGKAVLEYRINEYTRNEKPSDAVPFRQYRFDKVEIYHPETFHIREKLLRNLNTIIPGELYGENVVNNTYSRLSSLSILGGVNIEVTESDTAAVNAAISLTPSKLIGFKFNIEASSNSSGLFGISPGLSFFHKNLFRGGEVLNVNFRGNFQFKFNDDIRANEFGVSAGLRFPRFLLLSGDKFRKTVPSTEIKASYNYQDRPEYKRNIISTSYTYSGSHKKLYFQFSPIQLNIVRLFNIDPAFYESLSGNPFMRNAYQDHFDFGLGGTLYYTTNTDVTPHSTYHYFRFQLNSAGNLLSLFNPVMPKNPDGSRTIWNTPYSQYVRGEFTAGKTWVFGKNDRQSVATRLLAGAGFAYGNSEALPFEQHFYAGGANSLRGWQARSVGPGLSAKDTTFVIPNQTGDMKFEANLEYRFGLFWKVNGALFLDAGNVWTFNDKQYDGASQGTNSSIPATNPGKISAGNFIDGIAMDWGAGLRLDLNFILVRIDLGIVLRDPSREAGNRWAPPSRWFRRDGFSVHFGVGYPF